MRLRNAILPLFLMLFILSSFYACSKNEEEKKAEVPAAKAEDLLAKMNINENSQNVLFTYIDWKSQYTTVEKASDIPAEFRNDVIVVDLNLSPSERMAESKVIVADMEQSNEKGNFLLRCEDRAQFEKAVALKRQWKLSKTRQMPAMTQQQAQDMDIPANTDQVIIYSTSWCGYCKAAEKFMKEKGVAYVKKDIETDDQASLEMQAKCMRNGAQQCGVPVIDWKGQVILGFDEERMKALWQAEQGVNP